MGIVKSERSRKISQEAFSSNEEHLIYVKLDNKFTEIGPNAFSDCYGLKIVNFISDNQIQLKKICYNAFGGDDELKYFPFEKSLDLTTIEENSFDNVNIKKISLPEK